VKIYHVLIAVQIFSHVFKDCDKHFALYRKKGESTVNPKYALCLLGLMSSDPSISKLGFFHRLYFEDSNETVEVRQLFVPFCNVTNYIS
jgi:hypothetical protein